MDFNLSEEQTAIQDSLRRYLAKDYGFEQRRTIASSADGFSRNAWSTFAELGLLALPSDPSGALGQHPRRATGPRVAVIDRRGVGDERRPVADELVATGGRRFVDGPGHGENRLSILRGEVRGN